ncbi:MAG: hypothetical protein HUU15_17805 [Candidatus Brocadiae bacterium]|nr:hypothetical protein [Candidatus Brocadiia bacterium]
MIPWLEGVGRFLSYTASLPERTLRALAAGVGGVSKIVTDIALPEALRNTTTYRVLLGNMQRFVIERVGGVEKVYSDAGGELPAEFAQRKLAGNAIEALGMLSFHFSPIWLFAAGSDVVSGSRVYLDRLRTELVKQGVIDPADSPQELSDVLGAVEKATAASAKILDLPPLSAADLAKHSAEVTESWKAMFRSGVGMAPSFDGIWKRMNAIAKKENLSIEQVAGLMTVNAARTAGGLLAATTVAGDLFMENVLGSYAKSLDAMEKEGYAAFFTRTMEPYGEAILGAFNPDRETWTEWVVQLRMFRGGKKTS